tara:strand:+ start:92 stop:496 length:405 start_codon:yes stop_codon:yes gene_type:complete
MAIGGDLIEATYNNDVLGTGVFYFKGSEDGTFNLGGLTTADDSAMVDGSGTPIRIMNQKMWSVEGVVSWDMNTENELGKLQALTSEPSESSWTFSHVGQTVWAGKGFPVGDIAGNTGQATFAIKIAGGGKLAKA